MAARSELMWAAAMAENGILKIGKTTDFQAHMIEHQLGAFTDCNHGCGLAAIQPTLYRHLAPSAPAQYARLAREVFGVEPAGRTDLAQAQEGIDRLERLIRDVGLPTHLHEMGIIDERILRAVADTALRMPGCAKQLTSEEIFALLKEAV